MMNKIVRNFPASKLPKQLREGFKADAVVTVTVVTDDDSPSHKPMTLEQILALRRPPYRSSKEIVSEIRKLRAER